MFYIEFATEHGSDFSVHPNTNGCVVYIDTKAVGKDGIFMTLEEVKALCRVLAVMVAEVSGGA